MFLKPPKIFLRWLLLLKKKIKTKIMRKQTAGLYKITVSNNNKLPGRYKALKK